MSTLPSSSVPILRPLLAGVGGGVASVLLFYSAVRGGAGFGIVLLPLVPLPALIAALGWGLTAAFAALLATAVGMAAMASPGLAIGSIFALGLPVMGVVHLLSLARYNPDGTLAAWYPTGRVLMAIALYGAALPVLLVALDGRSYSAMAPALTASIKRVATEAPPGSIWRGFSAPQLDAAIKLWLQVMPALIACYWTLFFAINVYLAARIARLSGLLVRPWPDLHWLTYPTLLALAPVAAIAGVLVGGSPRVLGIGTLGAMLTAFLLQGLAVVHAIARARGATWLIAAAYASVVAFNGIGVVLIALLGVAETVAQVRARIIPIPAALPPGSI